MKKISIIILIVLIIIMIILLRNKNSNFGLYQDQPTNTEIENNNDYIANHYVNNNSYRTKSYLGSIVPSVQITMIRLYDLLNFY